MRIDIITVLPEMLEGFVHESILARAQKKGLAEICLHNLRDYTLDKWRRVDDYPFGGQAGMVMQIEPIDRCITALKAERNYDEVIFTSPDGEQFNQKIANDLSLGGNFIILCGGEVLAVLFEYKRIEVGRTKYNICFTSPVLFLQRNRNKVMQIIIFF